MSRFACALAAASLVTAVMCGSVFAQPAPSTTTTPAADAAKMKKQMMANCTKQASDQKLKGKKRTAFIKDCMSKPM